MGIAYEAVGLGSYGAALDSEVGDSVGGALGYQRFFDQTRKQCILELSGRTHEDVAGGDAIALALRYQQAFGKHGVWQCDAFGALHDASPEGWGLRSEIRLVF